MSNGMVTGGDNYIEIPVKNRSTTLKIQWGNTSGGNPDTIHLPKNFSNTNYAVGVLNTSGSSNTSDAYLTNKTVSGFSITQQVAKTESHSWIAVGY